MKLVLWPFRKSKTLDPLFWYILQACFKSVLSTKGNPHSVMGALINQQRSKSSVVYQKNLVKLLWQKIWEHVGGKNDILPHGNREEMFFSSLMA